MTIMLALEASAVSQREGLPRFISLSPNLHVSVGGLGFFGIELFNCAECGPYRGSIVAIDGGGPTTEGFDAPGIYYRLHRYAVGDLIFPNGFEWWTLRISIWYPLVITAILPAIWLPRRLRALRRRFLPVRRVDSQAKARGTPSSATP
jgi:hypothetical protein